MKTSRFSDPQIIAILKQAEDGVPVSELCREHGMSSASFYKWRAKYGGMDASLISEMKQLEDENKRLKRMFADLSMQNELLKEALGKKPLEKSDEAISTQGDGRTSGSQTWHQYCGGVPGVFGEPDLLSI